MPTLENISMPAPLILSSAQIHLGFECLVKIPVLIPLVQVELHEVLCHAILLVLGNNCG